MKVELNAWCHLQNVYTKFEIDSSKHVDKSPEIFLKIQNAQK